MPTYQYRCTECGHDLEAVQKFTDAALTECPNCGGQLRKVFNAVGVVFKGSGFYRTDSRSNGERNGGSKSADAGKESGAKESGGKESGGKGSGTDAGSTTGTKESKSPAPAVSSTSSSGSSTGAKAAGS